MILYMVNPYLSQKQRWVLTILLLAIALPLSIVFLAAFNTIYFEPTTNAVNTAHAAYPIIATGSITALVGSVGACIVARKRVWLFVLTPTIGIMSMFEVITNGFFVQFMTLAAIPILIILATEVRTNIPTGKIGMAIMSIMSLMILALAGFIVYVVLNPLDQTGAAPIFLSSVFAVQLLLIKFPLVFLLAALAVYASVWGVIYLRKDHQPTQRVVASFVVGGVSVIASVVAALYLMSAM